jgi:hypothetical protein
MKAMKKLLISTVLILLSAISMFGQTCEWAERIGGSGTDVVDNIAIDKLGDVFITGFFTSSNITFNNGIVLNKKNSVTDAYIAKYNSSGICQWAEKITGQIGSFIKSMVVDDSSNVYISGYFSSKSISFNNGKSLNNSGNDDAFIAKYNSSGTCEWAEKIAGTDADIATNIVVDHFQNIYVAGIFYSTNIIFNNGISLKISGLKNTFIAKFNTSGICQWAEKIVYNDYVQSMYLAVDYSDNIFFTDSFKSSVIFNNGISLTNNNDTLDVFITKYNTSGICQWAEMIEGKVIARSLEIDSAENIYIAGYFDSSLLSFNNNISLINSDNGDAYLAKFNSGGTCQWAEKIGGINLDEATSIKADKFGNVIVGGFFTSPTLLFNNNISLNNSGDHDIYFAKYNSAGTCQWAEKIGGDSTEGSNSIALDCYNSIYIAGAYISDTLYFNNSITLPKSMEYDGFIAKYSQNGTSVSDKPIQYNISIYPNPAEDYIEINFESCATLSKCGTTGDIQIFDMLGIIVSTPDCFTVTPASGGQRIDVSYLSPGIYFIKIGNRVEKFVKI